MNKPFILSSRDIGQTVGLQGGVVNESTPESPVPHRLGRRAMAATLMGSLVPPPISKEKRQALPEHLQDDPEAHRLVANMDTAFANLESLRLQVDAALVVFETAKSELFALWEGPRNAS